MSEVCSLSYLKNNCTIIRYLLVGQLVVLEIEPRALSMLSNHYKTELHSQLLTDNLGQNRNRFTVETQGMEFILEVKLSSAGNTFRQ